MTPEINPAILGITIIIVYALAVIFLIATEEE